MRIPFLLLLALGCSAAAPPEAAAPRTGAPPAANVDPKHAELARQLEATALAALADRDAPVPGFAVRVVSHGDVLLSHGYGLADLPRQKEVREDSIFRVGSLTKQFTAAAVLQLEEQGKLKLDDPLTLYLKDYPPPAKPVTLRHLLTHTSGIPGYTELQWFPSHMNQATPHEELVATFAKEPLQFDPGSRFSYSNSGYFLLGLVIERVSGQSYAEYLREHVLPGALHDTRYCPDAQDYERAALGYHSVAGKLEPAAPLSMTLPYSAGGLCSTVGDLVSWSRALASGKVVSAATFERMAAETSLSSGAKSPYGFGLFRDDLVGHARISHGGGINGFSSHLAYYPADDLFVAVLVNTETSMAAGLSEQLARVVLGVPEPELKDLALTEAEAKPVLGTYAIRELGQTILIAWDGSSLRLGPAQHPDKGARMLSQGGGEYVVKELKARVSFELEGGVAKILVVHQMGHEFRGERLP